VRGNKTEEPNGVAGSGSLGTNKVARGALVTLWWRFVDNKKMSARMGKYVVEN